MYNHVFFTDFGVIILEDIGMKLQTLHIRTFFELVLKILNPFTHLKCIRK